MPGAFEPKQAKLLALGFGYGLDGFNNEGVGFNGDKTFTESIL
jgi:hypothetical protein